MKVLLAILLILEEIFSISCQNENLITMSLLKNLEIRQCFCVYKNNYSSKTLFDKKILLKNIATAYISYEQLIMYLKQAEHKNDGAGVIMKERDLARLVEISQSLDLVGFCKINS